MHTIISSFSRSGSYYDTTLPKKQHQCGPIDDTESCSDDSFCSHGNPSGAAGGDIGDPRVAWQSLSRRSDASGIWFDDGLECWICFCPVDSCDSQGRPNGCKVHPAHIECLKHRIEVGRKDPKIGFGFLDCGVCRNRLDLAPLKDFMRPVLAFEQKVLALESRWAAVQKDDAHQFVFYSCFHCQEPFFGGLKRCQAADAEEPDPQTLVCASCGGAGQTSCAVHGEEFINYKCRFCCKMPATFTCGSTHYCEVCHNGAPPSDKWACPGGAECIFHGNHPENAENGHHEFALGCGKCLGVFGAEAAQEAAQQAARRAEGRRAAEEQRALAAAAPRAQALCRGARARRRARAAAAAALAHGRPGAAEGLLRDEGLGALLARLARERAAAGALQRRWRGRQGRRAAQREAAAAALQRRFRARAAERAARRKAAQLAAAQLAREAHARRFSEMRAAALRRQASGEVLLREVPAVGSEGEVPGQARCLPGFLGRRFFRKRKN